ncbi:MAG TPA: class I SAM-dependent methyltransferase [Coleofasciculaceae cyanobacterium]|jgi:2-polyprenyl-3-methyl-5-hydroxy-6-metoxy-1,4-benzoquinol methylase
MIHNKFAYTPSRSFPVPKRTCLENLRFAGDKRTIAAYSESQNAHFDRLDAFDPEISNVIDLFKAQNMPLGAKVLDAGCGPGRYVRWLLDKGYDAYGFDAWPDAIQKAQTTYPKLKNRLQNVSFSEAERAYAKNKNTFDAIFCAGVLYHLDRVEVREGIRLFKTLLNDNGKVFVSLSDHHNRNLDENRRDAQGRFFSDVTAEELKRMFIQEGFQLLEINYKNGGDKLTWTGMSFKKATR